MGGVVTGLSQHRHMTSIQMRGCPHPMLWPQNLEAVLMADGDVRGLERASCFCGHVLACDACQ